MEKVRCTNCGISFGIRLDQLKKIKRFGPCCSRQCSAEQKSIVYSGAGNPNHKHDKNLSMFYDLTHDGAYVLGMIYSDGHISVDPYKVEIYQHEKYGYNINRISEVIYNKDITYRRKDGLLILTINDKELVKHILSLGGIKQGHKSNIVSIPDVPKDKVWSFICGYFDGGGFFKYNYRYPEIGITSDSNKILEQISEYWGVGYNSGNRIEAYGYKALDICGRMYDKVSFRNNLKYDYYFDILNWEPLTCGPWLKHEYFKCKKLDPEAAVPTKSRVTDSGYDIYAIKLYKDGPFYVADTRLAVEPIPGYYFDCVGRSSLPAKFGFQFALGVGIIDRGYVGALKMYLLKIDERPLPELPFKCGQLIPRKIIHLDFIEVDKLNETSRGSDGFGSTDR